MIREEIQFLLKDLCSRLPYNFVYCYCNAPMADGKPIILTPVVISNLMNATDGLVIKPYLRLMSSMTKKEKKEYDKLRMSFYKNAKDASLVLVDWLNEHHFDQRGLIEKGLALEAPEGMYEIV